MLDRYPVWDAGTRWFHWINAISVITLAIVGFVIMQAGDLGVSDAGKATLKRVHVSVGYVMAANLLWRFVWAFIGNRHARWRAILPGGAGYWAALRGYVSAFLSGRPEPWLGHNPLGRIAVALILLLLTTMAATGLVIAGTDLFWPPFGGRIAEWVAAPGVDPATLVPYAPQLYDAAAWQEMREFRKPFVTVHEWGFYAIATVSVLHIAGVVITEVREGGSIVSAMFTGSKVFASRPRDADRADA